MTKTEAQERLLKKLNSLQKKYRVYCSDEGPSKSYSGKACMRSRVLKDISIVKLLKVLIDNTSESFVLDGEDEKLLRRLTNES